MEGPALRSTTWMNLCGEFAYLTVSCVRPSLLCLIGYLFQLSILPVHSRSIHVLSRRWWSLCCCNCFRSNGRPKNGHFFNNERVHVPQLNWSNQQLYQHPRHGLQPQEEGQYNRLPVSTYYTHLTREVDTAFATVCLLLVHILRVCFFVFVLQNRWLFIWVSMDSQDT